MVYFQRGLPSLREGSIIPDVPVVGEEILDKTQLSLLDVLLDGVPGFLLADLKFGIGKTRDLTDHVEGLLILVGVEWDVMEGTDHLALGIL